MLAVAFGRYEAALVDEYGYPRRMSEDEKLADGWDVDADIINYAKKRMDEWRKSNPEPSAGVTPRIVYHPTIRPDER